MASDIIPGGSRFKWRGLALMGVFGGKWGYYWLMFFFVDSRVIN